MYPHYAVFTESRRAEDENRFWFWNSMHFPVPMPAFDVECIDAPYQAVGEWQNRFFAVPPAIGDRLPDRQRLRLHHRATPSPTRRRSPSASSTSSVVRATTSSTGRSFYAGWRRKVEAPDRRDHGFPVPELPEYEPDALMKEDDRNTAVVDVLTAYSRTLRCGDLMWQHHFELLLLGYGAYVTFLRLLQERPPRHPGAAHRADGRRHRRHPLQAERRAAAARKARHL